MQLQFVQCCSQTNTPLKKRGLEQVKIVQPSPCCQPLPNCAGLQCYTAQNDPGACEYHTKVPSWSTHRPSLWGLSRNPCCDGTSWQWTMLACGKIFPCWMHSPLARDPSENYNQQAAGHGQGCIGQAICCSYWGQLPGCYLCWRYIGWSPLMV